MATGYVKKYRKIAQISKNGSVSLKVQKLSVLNGQWEDDYEFALTKQELIDLIETTNNFLTSNSGKPSIKALISEWDQY